jgi:hypothetical protein
VTSETGDEVPWEEACRREDPTRGLLQRCPEGPGADMTMGEVEAENQGRATVSQLAQNRDPAAAQSHQFVQ